MGDLFTTEELIGFVNANQAPKLFWLDAFFQEVMTFPTEKIVFDKVSPHKPLAPFVSPVLPGRAMSKQGSKSLSFTPAYTKPKTRITPDRVLKRKAGEAINGGLSPSQRWAALVADAALEMRNAVLLRLEWMAAQAIQTGKVIVSGEDYPSQTVDFDRDSGQLITLSGNDLWSDETNSNPNAKLEALCQQTNDLSGTVVTKLIFGSTAWTNYAKHPKVKDSINTLNRGNNTALETAYGLGAAKGSKFKGYILDGVEAWVYNDFYHDESGAQVPFMDARDVVGAGNVMGVRAFGAIMDASASYREMDIYLKHWIPDDPAIDHVMAQSGPLMVPVNANATFKVRVVS